MTIAARVSAFGAFVAFALPGAALGAQQVVKLTTPSATLAEEFTQVSRVREESSGRVIIVDRRDLRIVRADLARGTIEAIGRSGQGPGEYTIPMTVHGWNGDTSLVPDMDGAGRALVITSRGADARRLAGKGLSPDGMLFRTPRFDFDARGRMFTANHVGPEAGGSPRRGDSLAIERWDRGSGRRDTIAWVSSIVKSPLFTPSSRSAAANAPARAERGARGPFPFASGDQWAVDANGRVAVVTVDPYRVVFHTGSGAPVTGPEIAFTPVRVGSAEKEAYKARMSAPMVALSYTADRKASPRIVPGRYVEPADWPETLPPFEMDAMMDVVRFAPDGMLWVRRSVAAGKPPLFDVIDRAGRLAKQVELPPRTRLVGFGARSVYLVRLDEDDIERLERHALP